MLVTQKKEKCGLKKNVKIMSKLKLKIKESSNEKKFSEIN
jgi:hypothetical protein